MSSRLVMGAALLCLATSAMAQSQAERVRLDKRLVVSGQRLFVQEGEAQPGFVLGATALVNTTPNATVSGGRLSLDSSRWGLMAAYGSQNLYGVQTKGQYGAGVDYFFKNTAERATSLGARYVRNELGAQSTYYALSLDNEWPILGGESKPILGATSALTASVAYNGYRMAGKTTDAVTLAAGFKMKGKRLSLTGDYYLTNNVAGQDDYRIGLNYRASGSLSAAAYAGKKDTYEGRLSYQF